MQLAGSDASVRAAKAKLEPVNKAATRQPAGGSEVRGATREQNKPNLKQQTKPKLTAKPQSPQLQAQLQPQPQPRPQPQPSQPQEQQQRKNEPSQQEPQLGRNNRQEEEIVQLARAIRDAKRQASVGLEAPIMRVPQFARNQLL